MPEVHNLQPSALSFQTVEEDRAINEHCEDSADIVIAMEVSAAKESVIMEKRFGLVMPDIDQLLDQPEAELANDDKPTITNNPVDDNEPVDLKGGDLRPPVPEPGGDLRPPPAPVYEPQSITKNPSPGVSSAHSMDSPSEADEEACIAEQFKDAEKGRTATESCQGFPT